MYIDILLLAIIAGVILFKLYNVLGTETEESSQALASIMQKTMQDQNEKPEVDAEEMQMIEGLPSAEMQKIKKVKELIPEFHLGKFMQSVERAFETIIKAFKEYDLEAINFLTDGEAAQSFKQNIENLQKDKNVLNIEIVSIKEQKVKDVKVSREEVLIEIEFVSEQVFYTKNEQGEIISGDIHKIEEIADSWVFRKDLRTNSPVWKLIAVNA